jgi:hypothetical protein
VRDEVRPGITQLYHPTVPSNRMFGVGVHDDISIKQERGCADPAACT